MDFITDILQYRFLTNALIACVLSGITCGIVGTYVVCRRLVFLSGGITHSSFGGIGIAYYLGLNPTLGALVFAVLSALGIIFIYMTPGYAPNLMSFLFGNILTVTDSDIRWLAVLTLVVVSLFALAARRIMYVAFDRGFARSQGIPTEALSYGMAVLTAVTIVLSIRIVGIVMLISLLTMPAVIVNTRCKRFAAIMRWSALTAVCGNIIGLALSYRMNIPAGAATIFVLTITLIIVKIVTLRSISNKRRR